MSAVPSFRLNVVVPCSVELVRYAGELGQERPKKRRHVSATDDRFIVGDTERDGDELTWHDLWPARPHRARSRILLSTIKIRQAGFTDCIDTEDMVRKWYKRFQELRLLPRYEPFARHVAAPTSSPRSDIVTR